MCHWLKILQNHKGFNLFLLFAKAVDYALQQIGTTDKEKYKNKNNDDLNNFDKVYIAKQLRNDNEKFRPSSVFKVLSDLFTNLSSKAYV